MLKGSPRKHYTGLGFIDFDEAKDALAAMNWIYTGKSEKNISMPQCLENCTIMWAAPNEKKKKGILANFFGRKFRC